MSVRPSFRRVLPFAIFLSLSLPPALAQDAGEPPAPEQQLEAITVTGSRIPRAQVEGPAPVIVIKGDDIDKGGYRSVFDVLTQLTQNTGLVQGEDFGSTFTPAANVISLRGLGPNYTLVLVNGHRVADYPVAYNGSVNAVDFANVPSVMIDRIEILSGSASAIYGSDAIAGVVNIILKQQHEGVDLSLKAGGTQRGGGDNQRVQLIGGGHWGDLGGVFGLELTNREPVWYGDRGLSDSYTRYDDSGQPPPQVAGIRDPASRNYYPLDCSVLGSLMGGSVHAFERPRYGGSYCSSDHYYSNRTIQTKKKLATGYANLTYALNGDAELFGDFMAGWSDIATVVRNPNWTSPTAFWNEATGRLESWTRLLAPEETGGRMASARTFLQRQFNATVGARGSFGDSGWKYVLAANRSDYTSDQGVFRFLRGVDDYFLGPQTGTHDYGGDTFPSYDADPSRLTTPLDARLFRSLSTHTLERDKAWTEDLSFSVNGELLQLPAGPLGVAAVVEVGRQGFSKRPDPRINAGEIWNLAEAHDDDGRRNRYAAGVELNVPIFAQLTGIAAARYDRYTYSGQSIGKSTYNLGLEYRPFETLLLRGTYSTSFRAPDMNYLFAKGTVGYEPGNTDFYQCALDGQSYSGCDVQYNMNFRSSGNLGLKPENGKSFTYGVVWSPLDGLDLTADYYRIRIRDAVTNLDSEIILRTEADCRIGHTESGTPVDIGSSLCRDALARVVRNPSTAPVNPNQVTNLLLNPINAATERTSGIDLAGNYRWTTDRYGRFLLHAGFTRVLGHQYQQFAGDPVRDYVNDVTYQQDWRKKTNAALSWSLGAWSATINGTRYGSVPRNDGEGRRSPYTLVNGSVGYDLSDRAHLSLIVNNLRNSLPVDKSAGWPNYSAAWYDLYGRQWWLQFDYHFGAGKRG